MSIADTFHAVPRLDLANLPTRIYRLDRISEELGKNIYIKRDDQTGTEVSGNKIRKLEYSMAEAISRNAGVVITAGGIQSNHARSVAAVCARLGIRSHLVLDISEDPVIEGNLLLDKLFGAEITYLDERAEKKTLSVKMREIAGEYEAKGIVPYIIPVGASNGIGNLGYIGAVEEIAAYERENGTVFDAIVCAAGSGGTFSGLYLGNRIFELDKRIVGVTVCDNREYFRRVTESIMRETLDLLGGSELEARYRISGDDLEFIDGYKGRGYALSKEDELLFIAHVARMEGVVLDPVYTGKAFYGLYNEVKKGTFDKEENILFIHTGGLYGLFPKQEQFAPLL